MLGILMKLIRALRIICAIIEFRLAIDIEGVFDAVIKLCCLACFEQKKYDYCENDMFHMYY